LANNIAQYLNKPIFYQKITPAIKLREDQLISLFDEGFKSCDGIIRPGSFWDEEFTTIKYRKNLVPMPHLRINAFEGEYYRNMERLPYVSHRSSKSFVRWEMVFRFAGHNFTSHERMMQTEDRIINKLEIMFGKFSPNLIFFKEYYRQVVVPSYRSLQGNTENRFGFCISPFADLSLSYLARNAFSFLGNSLDFELTMLNRLDRELARLPNDYGFDFSAGERKSFQLGIKLWQIMPPYFKHRLFTLYRKSYKDDYIYKLSSQSAFIRLLLEYVRSLHLPLDIQKMTNRSTRGRLVLNLGYFLKVNEEWLSW